MTVSVTSGALLGRKSLGKSRAVLIAKLDAVGVIISFGIGWHTQQGVVLVVNGCFKKRTTNSFSCNFDQR